MWPNTEDHSKVILKNLVSVLGVGAGLRQLQWHDFQGSPQSHYTNDWMVHRDCYLRYSFTKISNTLTKVERKEFIEEYNRHIFLYQENYVQIYSQQHCSHIQTHSNSALNAFSVYRESLVLTSYVLSRMKKTLLIFMR